MKPSSTRFIALCGRIFRDTDPAFFPRVERGGHVIYLCTHACMEAFLADPEAFFRSHRNYKKKESSKKKDELHILE